MSNKKIMFRAFVIFCGVFLSAFMFMAFYMLPDEGNKPIGLLLYFAFGLSLPIAYNWNKMQ